jgi:glucosyl-dolichyl phosphate glucuronosyltransferase
MPGFSFIICTHNRSQILKDCLESIRTQGAALQHCEMLVIDNNSIDDTKATVKKFEAIGVRYVFEGKTGLSHARNRGATEAKGEWLCYIDDDAKLHPGYIERALWVINHNDFDCFGGMYYAWYPYGKPKWVDDSFGTKLSLRDAVGQIEVPELSGGNFLIKRDVLENAGGFSTQFGMTGDRIGYGEEDFLQRKLLDMGYKLGFDPELKIDHAVLPHKLELSWHLASWYAHGRDGHRFSGEPKFIQIIWLFMRSFFGGLIKLPIGIGKSFIKRNYFWQNLVWDVVSPMLFRIGQIVGNFK